MKNKICALLFVIIFLAFIYANGVLGASNADDLQVSFINVGQGDAALIQDGNGFDILIDGGKTVAGPTVVAYLREHAVDNIDIMIASHADTDHIGGLINVLEADDIPVKQVIYNGYEGSTVTWTNFVNAVHNNGLSLTAAQFPQEFTWGETTAYILNPPSDLVNPDTNDASVVILLAHGNNKFLFTGDIDSSIESSVVARSTPIAADILKVAHHGSKYSSSSAFLSAVAPSEAVISVGDNTYGHPAEDTQTRLTIAGVRIWRTDQAGTIVVSSNGNSFVIDGEIFQASTKLYLPIIIYHIPQPDTDPTPSPTEEPVANTGNVLITNVFYDGVVSSSEPDEYVEIRNNDSKTIQLLNWMLRDNANHTFTFPNFLMEPGTTCRIYTNEYHAEWCGFNYGIGSAIWNNSGDCGYLYDSTGSLLHKYCY